MDRFLRKSKENGYGTWNAMGLYRAGSLTTLAK
jgi:hypothetical protein